MLSGWADMTVHVRWAWPQCNMLDRGVRLSTLMPTVRVLRQERNRGGRDRPRPADVSVMVTACASNLFLLSPASLWGVLINSVGAHRCDEFRQTLINGFRAHHKLCDPSTYASLAFEDTVQTPQSIHSTSGYIKTPIYYGFNEKISKFCTRKIWGSQHGSFTGLRSKRLNLGVDLGVNGS